MSCAFVVCVLCVVCWRCVLIPFFSLHKTFRSSDPRHAKTQPRMSIALPSSFLVFFWCSSTTHTHTHICNCTHMQAKKNPVDLHSHQSVHFRSSVVFCCSGFAPGFSTFFVPANFGLLLWWKPAMVRRARLPF